MLTIDIEEIYVAKPALSNYDGSHHIEHSVDSSINLISAGSNNYLILIL